MFDLYQSVRMEMNSSSIVGYFLQALPIAILAGIIYVIVRVITLKKHKGSFSWIKELARLLFVCYLTGLISLVILPANFWLHIYDGIFFGWWEYLFPIVEIGDVNLVPTLFQFLLGS